MNKKAHDTKPKKTPVTDALEDDKLIVEKASADKSVAMPEDSQKDNKEAGDTATAKKPSDLEVKAADELDVAPASLTKPRNSISLDEADSERPEPGMYPQENGSVKVILDVPLMRGETEIYEVIVHGKPPIGAVDSVGGQAALMNMNLQAHGSVMASVTEPPITQKIWQKMYIQSNCDTTHLMAALTSFFISSTPKGKSPD